MLLQAWHQLVEKGLERLVHMQPAPSKATGWILSNSGPKRRRHTLRLRTPTRRRSLGAALAYFRWNPVARQNASKMAPRSFGLPFPYRAASYTASST